MMDDIKTYKKPKIVHVPAEDDEDEQKCLETSENDTDGAVPLGLTGKAVCMQVKKKLIRFYVLRAHQSYICRMNLPRRTIF